MTKDVIRRYSVRREKLIGAICDKQRESIKRWIRWESLGLQMTTSINQPIPWAVEQTLHDAMDNSSEVVLPVESSPSSDAPSLIVNAGPAARFAWEELLYGKIRNPHTRRSYDYAIRRFLAHCRELGRSLSQITPRAVGGYLDRLELGPGTKKIHLAAIRRLFDELVVRHVVVLNPAASVRSERLQNVEGKTPEIGIEPARKLIRSIDATNVVGLRDRAIIGILTYTAVRVGAIAKLRCGDFYADSEQHNLRFAEKRGKSREIPVRHDLQQFIASYLDAAGTGYSERTTPLFRTAIRRTRRLTQLAMSADDISRMVKRRICDAGLSDRLSAHSFRVTIITDLLSQGVPLEDVQNLAGHADPRTTRLYDRRQRQVTRNIVERISV